MDEFKKLSKKKPKYSPGMIANATIRLGHIHVILRTKRQHPSVHPSNLPRNGMNRFTRHFQKVTLFGPANSLLGQIDST